jgi:ubiquinone/menaquinone biosynthesis C-methylase UbiE
MRLLRRKDPSPAAPPATDRTLPRADYKSVWNAVAGDVETAKLAVSGYTDEEEYRKMGESTVLTLQQHTGLHPTDVVLEIGAGVGRVGPAIAPLVKKWIACDVSENMLAHVRERTRQFDNVETVAVNGWDLSPIPDESVDLVYCTVVFMHLDEWDRYNYVREAMRILRPGGRVYVDNFNLLGDEGWAFFMKHLEEYSPLDRPPNISKSSTPEELHAYLTRAGFEGIIVHSNEMWIWVHATKPQ